jgi:hypothetical protein
MRHATPATLDTIEDLLDRIRQRPELRERKRGAFYRKSSGFLHFHEDPAGLFADVKTGAKGFERFKVDTDEEREAMLAAVGAALTANLHQQGPKIV